MSWVFGAAVIVLVGLGLALVVGLVRSELRQRRKARYFAQLAAQYRKARPALPASTAQEPESEPNEAPRPVVTVAELVARVEAEGLPVRLKWDEGDESRHGPDEDEWPTGILPRVDDPRES